MTLGHVTQEASLAKIDPDTGLQFDEGPEPQSVHHASSARHYFGAGLLQASVSKADARDLSDGAPVPEAPRLIVDVLGTLDRLPFHLHARAEFEEVGRKPLGMDSSSVPVREFRGALVRSFTAAGFRPAFTSRSPAATPARPPKCWRCREKASRLSGWWACTFPPTPRFLQLSLRQGLRR